MADSNKCFNCNLSENNIPLVSMTFAERKLWICLHCLPTLIHRRKLIQEKLDDVKNSIS